MGYNTSINGFIKGISEDSFNLIKDDLEEAFDTIMWKDNTIEISSYGKHYSPNTFPVYDKIAFCIDEDGGTLEEEGEEMFDFSVIFFCKRQWKQLWVEVNYPDNPFLKPLESTN